jgi:DNA-binding CsgD family transcriptional regulator
MEITAIDHGLAKTNPWGLTARNCHVLRQLCLLGTSKAVALETGLSFKSVDHHLSTCRRKMGYRGSDLRYFVDWVGWLHRQRDQLDTILKT